MATFCASRTISYSYFPIFGLCAVSPVIKLNSAKILSSLREDWFVQYGQPLPLRDLCAMLVFHSCLRLQIHQTFSLEPGTYSSGFFSFLLCHSFFKDGNLTARLFSSFATLLEQYGHHALSATLLVLTQWSIDMSDPYHIATKQVCLIELELG